MKFLSLISDHPDSLYAIDSLIGDVAMHLKGRPDAVFLFFTTFHAKQAAAIARRVTEQLEPQALLGCSAESVIGFDREIEQSPGIALLAAQMPDVKFRTYHCDGTDWPDMLKDADILKQRLAPAADSRAMLAFADPYTTPMMQLLPAVSAGVPGLPIIGGMASGANSAGEARLILDGAVHDDGLVGMTICGPVEVETVVSQGCRPVGRTFVITKAHDNVIDQLGGQPALLVAQEVVSNLTEQEQGLLDNGLFVGRVINEYKENFERGDFLVRNVMRVSQTSGAIAITDYVRAGQTVQFQLRDAQSADEDLTDLLSPLRPAPPAGGLLFSCNGRGQRMFQTPCHDIGAAQKILPRTPVAGFFAAGELGPVGGKNFIHGQTASFAMFRPSSP